MHKNWYLDMIFRHMIINRNSVGQKHVFSQNLCFFVCAVCVCVWGGGGGGGLLNLYITTPRVH